MMEKYFNPEYFRSKKNRDEYVVKIKIVYTSTGIWPALPKVINRIASSVIYRRATVFFFAKF